jgi:trimethylamine--corrinoid protein Co-methyltransferase
MKGIRPTVRPLSTELVEKIHGEALDVLAGKGIFVENDEALELLDGAGARPQDAGSGDAGRVVRLPGDLVTRALESAPKRIRVFDAAGEPAMDLGDDRVHFDPGSAAINILDGESGRQRKPTSQDALDFSRLTNALAHMSAQSTGVVPADVPEGLADRYRLYLALHGSRKPVVTGTFEVEALAPMLEMLSAIRGGADALREKPLAIFDACPSPPLRWSRLTCQSLIDCARAGVPSEIVSMPLSGATAPVTLLGSVVQHCAEVLSAYVIAHLAAPGAPVVYGGSPAVFDMRKGTTPMGAIETMMIDSANVQVGKHLGLPTHAYMALSDSKELDAQAGLESGMGAVMAALSGVNMVSGPGMLDYESCQSLEKLVLDNEICGMALRLIEGLEPREEQLAADLMEESFTDPRFLSRPSTLKWFRKEQYIPGKVIERSTLGEWEQSGRVSLTTRALNEVTRILAKEEKDGYRLDEALSGELTRIIDAEAKGFGVNRLPVLFPAG